MQLINLTPHAINVVNEVGDVVFTYPASGIVARVTQKDFSTGHYAGQTPVVCAIFGETESLPEPAQDVYYICSFIVCQANSSRNDLISPNTGPTAKRNEQGQILGVRNFVSHSIDMQKKAHKNYEAFAIQAREDIAQFTEDLRLIESRENHTASDIEMIEMLKRQIASLSEYCK